MGNVGERGSVIKGMWEKGGVRLRGCGSKGECD